MSAQHLRELGGYRGSGHPGEAVQRHPGAVARIPAARRPERRRERLIGRAYTATWELLRRVPEPVAFGLAELAGRLSYRLQRRTRARVAANLARVVAPAALAETVRAAFRSYARYWVETFRVADIDPVELDRRTTVRGMREYLDGVLAEGRGAIVLLAHHGSWDVAAHWGESHGYHLAVVAEVLRPRRVFDKFVELREALGLDVVPLRRGADLVSRLSKTLAANHLIGLLSERDLTGRGPVVELFGEEARLPPGPVVLSQRTGAPIVPATVLQRPRRRWEVVVLPPIEVGDLSLAEGAARVAAALEELISLAPEQWHAFQPVWLADLPPRRRGDWTPPGERGPR